MDHLELIRITRLTPGDLIAALRVLHSELSGDLSGPALNRWTKQRGGTHNLSPEDRVSLAAAFPMRLWLSERAACRFVPPFGEYLKHFAWGWRDRRARDEKAWRELRRIFGEKPPFVHIRSGDPRWFADRKFSVPGKRRGHAPSLPLAFSAGGSAEQ